MNAPFPPISIGLCLASIGLLAPNVGLAESSTAPTEFRVGVGTGPDATVEGEGGLAFAISGTLLLGLNSDWVVGASAQRAATILGGTNTHGGLVFGNAGHGTSYTQLLVEAGVHHSSGVGDGLFVSSDAEPVDLPYVGAMGRWVFDVGEPKGVVIDLSLSGKRDVFQSSQDARTMNCLFECTSEEREFVVGGWHVVGGVGIGLKF